MSILLGLLSIMAPIVPGFVVAYLLRLRSRTWGSVLLSAGLVLGVSGWLAAFSLAGLVLLLIGVGLIGAGLEGMALAGRSSTRNAAP